MEKTFNGFSVTRSFKIKSGCLFKRCALAPGKKKKKRASSSNYPVLYYAKGQVARSKWSPLVVKLRVYALLKHSKLLKTVNSTKLYDYKMSHCPDGETEEGILQQLVTSCYPYRKWTQLQKQTHRYHMDVCAKGSLRA